MCDTWDEWIAKRKINKKETHRKKLENRLTVAANPKLPPAAPWQKLHHTECACTLPFNVKYIIVEWQLHWHIIYKFKILFLTFRSYQPHTLSHTHTHSSWMQSVIGNVCGEWRAFGIIRSIMHSLETTSTTTLTTTTDLFRAHSADWLCKLNVVTGISVNIYGILWSCFFLTSFLYANYNGIWIIKM